MDTSNWDVKQWRWILYKFNKEQAMENNFLAITAFIVLSILAIIIFTLIAIFIQKFKYRAESTHEKFYEPVETEGV